MPRTLLMVAAMLLAMAGAQPAAAQSGDILPGPEEAAIEEIERIDASIAYIDTMLKGASQGAMVLVRSNANESDVDVDVLFMVSREEFTRSLLMSVALGEMTAEEASAVAILLSRQSAGSVAYLKASRQTLVSNRQVVEQTLAGLRRAPSGGGTKSALRPWEVARPPDTKVVTCVAEGVWGNTAEGRGSSTWTIKADGEATESGMGNARGQASMGGDTLTITWRTGAVAGVYSIDVFSDCSGGDGTLSFTDGPPGFDRSPAAVEFSRVSGPTGGEAKF